MALGQWVSVNAYTNHWQNNHRTAKGRHHPCSGNTATCMGLESGIEAAIHAVRKSFEEDNSTVNACC